MGCTTAPTRMAGRSGRHLKAATATVKSPCGGAQAAAKDDRGNSMKLVNIEKSDLNTCVEQAQRGRVVIIRDRKPIALIVGVEGLNREQLELGSSDKFWRLIEQRRSQKTIARAKRERRIRRSSRMTHS